MLEEIKEYYSIYAEVEDSDYYQPFYLQNIIDIDGDGMSELVVDEAWGEDYGVSVYKYDGNSVSKVMDYYRVEECP